jgi:hypothetical protein
MMDAMQTGESDRPILRREVEAPQRQPNGLGVMLIASAAMFFAVAGSAFVVRARMAGHCCDREHPQASAAVERPVAAPATVAPLDASGEPCGQAIYRTNPDGTVAVDFRLCPPEKR